MVIAAKNAEKTIEGCLGSVQRSNPAEIIVIDGVSSDKTIKIARRYTARVFSDEGRGPSYAHQLGAEQATQEYIAYVDSDIILPDGALTTLLAELKATDYVSMTGRVIAANLSTYWEWATDWNNRLLQARRGGGLFATVLRRATILKYKFNPSIRNGEDYDFQLRLEKAGYKLGTSSAVVFHHHRADLISLTKWRFVYAKSFSRFIRKYGPWHAGFWPLPTRIYWLFICLAKGKPKLVPYFMVDGIAQTAGMAKGMFELARESLKKAN